MEHTHVNNQDRKSFKYTKDHNKAIVCKTAVLQKPQLPEPETPTRTERWLRYDRQEEKEKQERPYVVSLIIMQSE